MTLEPPNMSCLAGSRHGGVLHHTLCRHHPRARIGKMRPNRSVPSASVIPVLAYADVRQATEWLCRVFGFVERLRIAEHRAQLNIGEDGAMIVAEYIDSRQRPKPASADLDRASHLVMVRVADVQGHYERALHHGAEILQTPVEHPFGERQYVARDIGGHRWTFSQTISDVHPDEWGGPEVELISE